MTTVLVNNSFPAMLHLATLDSPFYWTLLPDAFPLKQKPFKLPRNAPQGGGLSEALDGLVKKECRRVILTLIRTSPAGAGGSGPTWTQPRKTFSSAIGCSPSYTCRRSGPQKCWARVHGACIGRMSRTLQGTRGLGSAFWGLRELLAKGIDGGAFQGLNHSMVKSAYQNLWTLPYSSAQSTVYFKIKKQSETVPCHVATWCLGRCNFRRTYRVRHLA
jgi:hypothetical protein